MRRLLTIAVLLLAMATYAAPASAQGFYRAYRPYYGPTYGYSYYGPAYGYAAPYYYAPRAYWGAPYRPYAGFYRYPTYGYPGYYYGW